MRFERGRPSSSVGQQQTHGVLDQASQEDGAEAGARAAAGVSKLGMKAATCGISWQLRSRHASWLRNIARQIWLSETVLSALQEWVGAWAGVVSPVATHPVAQQHLRGEWLAA
jgi:hypothetical protein